MPAVVVKVRLGVASDGSLLNWADSSGAKARATSGSQRDRDAMDRAKRCTRAASALCRPDRGMSAGCRICPGVEGIILWMQEKGIKDWVFGDHRSDLTLGEASGKFTKNVRWKNIRRTVHADHVHGTCACAYRMPGPCAISGARRSGGGGCRVWCMACRREDRMKRFLCFRLLSVWVIPLIGQPISKHSPLLTPSHTPTVLLQPSIDPRGPY